jgi:transposase
MTNRTRRKIDAASNTPGRKQLQEQAARAFEAGNGDSSAEREREIERLHAKIGQLIVERDF